MSAHARMQNQQQFAGRSVGTMDGETPTLPVGFGANLRAMVRHYTLVVVAPCLGAPGGDAAGAFRLDEFDAARIREAFFGRIDDLHHVAMRAGGRELSDS